MWALTALYRESCSTQSTEAVPANSATKLPLWVRKTKICGFDLKRH